MNSRDQAHEEDRQALKKLERQPLIIATVALAVIAVATAVIYGIVNSHQTDLVRRQTLAGCQLYKLVAEAPLSTPTSPFALQLSAGGRNAFRTAHCSGSLKPADPRVVPYLDQGVQ